MPSTEIIHPDGRTVLRHWEPGTRPAYEWLRRAIAAPDQSAGGWIELLVDHGEVLVWINEEGRLLDLPANVPAMRKIGWREPPEGWAQYDGHMGDQPMMMFASTPEEHRQMRETLARTWSPVVGPVLIMRGFLPATEEGDYVEKELNPELGQELPAAT